GRSRRTPPTGPSSGNSLPTSCSSTRVRSRAGELLDAVVAGIGDVDVPAPVGRDAEGADGAAELSVARALTPPGGEEAAARVELLDAAVVRIRDVDVPAPVGRHAVGGGELSDARAVAPPTWWEQARRGRTPGWRGC